jgi:hypothetical protein
MTMAEVDERFAFITNAEGRKFQVLRYETNDTGESVPVDWDEAATAALVRESERD